MKIFLNFHFKPLKPAGISGNSYVDNMESAPVASTPVAASPVVSESPSGGSSVATGSVWDRLAGTERMKVLFLYKCHSLLMYC